MLTPEGFDIYTAGGKLRHISIPEVRSPFILNA